MGNQCKDQFGRDGTNRGVIAMKQISLFLTDSSLFYDKKLKSMAHANIELVEALRLTAKKLKNGVPYAWGNHGTCNCGNLLQSVTQLTKEEILKYAHTGVGEWTELAEDYCGVTDAPVSLLVSKLAGIGLTATDVHNLEYLDSRKVLEMLPGGFRWLKRNIREDVIVYFETFADMLEEKLLEDVKLPANLFGDVEVETVGLRKKAHNLQIGVS